MKTKVLFLIAATLISMLQAQTPTKKVLLEEFTTTLCGNCPPSSKSVHDWYENHHANAVLMVHHAGFGTDAMTNTDATNICNYFKPSTFGFAPAVLIDRDVYPWVDSVPYMPVSGFDTIADRVSQNTAPVAVNIQGSYNATTRQLSITASATFIQAVASGSKRLNIYLIEDSLIGNGSGWDQKCYSSSFANTYYPGQYNSSTSTIIGYPHRNVQRGSLNGGTWGTSNIIPNSPVVNTTYTLTVNYTVPSNFNDARLSVVAYVANYGSNKFNRQILNATEVKINSLQQTTGFENETKNEINAVYPNPVDENITILYTLKEEGLTKISLYDLTGSKIQDLEPGSIMTSGRYEATFDCKNIMPGVYFIQMNNGKQITNRKIIVQH
jgi:hypothetical protein